MKNSTVYCVMNVCSCLVMVWRFCIFWCGYGMAGGYFTDVVLHSLKNYHQERATELRRLSKDVAAAYGAVVTRCDGYSNLY
jgi:hypothetical protein